MIEKTTLIQHIDLNNIDPFSPQPFGADVYSSYAIAFLEAAQRFTTYEYVALGDTPTVSQRALSFAIFHKTEDLPSGWEQKNMTYPDACNEFILAERELVSGERAEALTIYYVLFYNERRGDTELDFVFFPKIKTENSYDPIPMQPFPNAQLSCRMGESKEKTSGVVMQNILFWFIGKEGVNIIDYTKEDFRDIVSRFYTNECACKQIPNHCRKTNDPPGVIVTYKIETSWQNYDDVYQCEINEIKSDSIKVRKMLGEKIIKYCQNTKPKPKFEITRDGNCYLSCSYDNNPVMCGTANNEMIGFFHNQKTYILSDHGLMVNPFRLAVITDEIACLDKETKEVISFETVKNMINQAYYYHNFFYR